MKTILDSSRRDFLAQLTAVTSMVAWPTIASAAEAPSPARRFKIAGFTKPFQNLSFAETSDVVAEIGWDGIECAVRKGGHVLPERVEDDLPKLVEALKQRNLELTTIVTDIHNITDPLTDRVLRAASKSGVKLYRLAHLAYDRKRSIAEDLNSFRSELRDLLALNKELGLCMAYENHSGVDSVGAAIWDMAELLKDFDPKYSGIFFDIGHATIEGGLAWPTNLRLVQPLVRAVYVKDFTWQKSGGTWKSVWCPLGEGMVSRSFFATLKNSAFTGPIVQHHEYPVGSGAEMIKAMRKDLEVLQGWLG